MITHPCRRTTSRSNRKQACCPQGSHRQCSPSFPPFHTYPSSTPSPIHSPPLPLSPPNPPTPTPTDNIKMFTLDEADEMLSRGFKDQIYDIFQLLPPKLQVGVWGVWTHPCCCSARPRVSACGAATRGSFIS